MPIRAQVKTGKEQAILLSATFLCLNLIRSQHVPGEATVTQIGGLGNPSPTNPVPLVTILLQSQYLLNELLSLGKRWGSCAT